MVPLCSGRIARVPPYSLCSMRSFFRVRGYHPLWPDFPDCSTRTYTLIGTGLFRFRSPLLTESRLISIPPVTEMFQFTGFALVTYVFSHEYRRSGGFPHSEIFGSKHICRLPEAYRRLPRPSSPSVAKASTMCAYSLDHITPSDLESYHSINWFSNATSQSIDKKMYLCLSVKTNCRIFKEHIRVL
jgi:hypothetical protein